MGLATVTGQPPWEFPRAGMGLYSNKIWFASVVFAVEDHALHQSEHGNMLLRVFRPAVLIWIYRENKTTVRCFQFV
jgi:hypothetical protein